MPILRSPSTWTGHGLLCGHEQRRTRNWGSVWLGGINPWAEVSKAVPAGYSRVTALGWSTVTPSTPSIAAETVVPPRSSEVWKMTKCSFVYVRGPQLRAETEVSVWSIAPRRRRLTSVVSAKLSATILARLAMCTACRTSRWWWPARIWRTYPTMVRYLRTFSPDINTNRQDHCNVHESNTYSHWANAPHPSLSSVAKAVRVNSVDDSGAAIFHPNGLVWIRTGGELWAKMQVVSLAVLCWNQ